MAAFRLSALIALALSYVLYIPLPAENAIDRVKVQVAEIGMRLGYFYPMNALKVLGVDWQVWWARKSLSFLVRILSYKMWFQPNDGVRVSKANFSGVPLLVYEPEQRKSDGAVVLIHGGGFVLLDPLSYDQLARQVAVSAGVVVFSVEYRKAPEHIFPAALDDCETAIAYLLNQAYRAYKLDPNRVAIMGDSAGGNLAAGSILRLMDKSSQLVKPKLQVLMYPLMQFINFRTPSYREAGFLYGGSALADPESIARLFSLYMGLTGAETDILMRNDHVTKESIAEFAPFLLEEMREIDLPFNASHSIIKSENDRSMIIDQSIIDKSIVDRSNQKERIVEVREKLESLLFNPDLSPMVRKDLSKSPKTFLMTCEYDPLRDEGYWYMKRLRNAGVDVRWHHYRYAFHAIINMHGELYLAERMLDDVVAFLDQNL